MAEMTKRALEAGASLILDAARAKAKECQTGVELHNFIYGIGSKFAEIFPTAESRRWFMESPQGAEVTSLIQKLGGYLGEESGKILVRVPKSIHAGLIAEAAIEGVSLNQLCLAKLSVQLRAAVGV